jgi:hypothetical protein
VRNKQFGFEEPDIGFDACAAVTQRIVQGDAAPVVVVGVARDRGDALGYVEWDGLEGGGGCG